jgi:hypothetical protein
MLSICVYVQPCYCLAFNVKTRKQFEFIKLTMNAFCKMSDLAISRVFPYKLAPLFVLLILILLSDLQNSSRVNWPT